MMLLAEALVRLLELWDDGLISQLPDALLRDRLPITLIQILNRTLMSQSIAGFGASNQLLEATAYAVLTLKTLASLPWLTRLSKEVFCRIDQGRQLLWRCGSNWSTTQYLWVEKVTYGSPILSEAYYLAAMFRTKQTRTWNRKVESLVPIVKKEETKITHLFCKLQCFQSESTWKISASILEALVFLPQLKCSSVKLLGGEQSAKNEYLSFIPCTWVAINNVQRLFLNTDLLWDMMVLTLRNFRVDEYMETTIAMLSESDLDEAKTVIQTLCDDWMAQRQIRTNDAGIDPFDRSALSPSILVPSQDTRTSPPTDSPSLSKIRATLVPYVDAILGHPQMACLSQQDHCALSKSLIVFLNSHIDQSLVNAFASRKPHALPPFIHWLHNIAAPSVSASFSFTFLTCLLGGLSNPME